MKWLREDMGNYYAPGSYGINIFDNLYTLFLQTDHSASKPQILKTEPAMPTILFYNYLTINESNKDSMYIAGFPFANERYLYGTLPANRASYRLKGDIPEPSLFLAQYFTEMLEKDTIVVKGEPSCYRILTHNNAWNIPERKLLTASYSIPIKELIRITNHVSHNLYADALLKTIGIKDRTSEHISSFEKGVKIVKYYWADKGLQTSSLWMYDGCGLATTDKLTASFVCDVLSYMYKQSSYFKSFFESLPRAGLDGTVANMLKGSVLQEKTRIKSGSMSRVRSYAGYYISDDKQYAFAILVNNFSCTQAQIKKDIEQLLLSLLP
jgi:D-alanyl-D-alanine carboxypeptidase/D-alanyl-D-alanine-endopeptidase (penicillin-binding protein 4)